MGMIKEYIIKIDEDQSKKDIHGGYPLIETPLELIRCKDCKHLEHLSWMDEKNGKKCYVCNKHTFTGMREEEWFCADGERMDA